MWAQIKRVKMSPSPNFFLQTLEPVPRETFARLVPVKLRWQCHVSVSTRRSRWLHAYTTLKFRTICISGDMSPKFHKFASIKYKKILPSTKAENATIKKSKGCKLPSTMSFVSFSVRHFFAVAHRFEATARDMLQWPIYYHYKTTVLKHWMESESGWDHSLKRQQLEDVWTG